MVLRPQSAALSNPSLRSPKNPNENFKLKRNLRWPTTRTLDLPSSTRSHGGSLSLIGRSVQNLLRWTSVCSWSTPYLADWRRNWQLSLCCFTSGTTITSAWFVFAGNLINPSRRWLQRRSNSSTCFSLLI